MTIHEFAIKHRLKVWQDKDDGMEIIPGTQHQSHIYEDDGELGVMSITPATKPARPFFWRKHRDLGLAAGMKLRQNGDAEGCLTFNPGNAGQLKIAFRLAGVERKRQMNQKQMATLARFHFPRDRRLSFDLISRTMGECCGCLPGLILAIRAERGALRACPLCGH
jgi:hypothetical protein